MFGLLNKILRPFGMELIRIKITFRGEEREGGYIYLTSPELKGFTFMLEPGERDLDSIIKAIDEPLNAFLNADIAYKHALHRRRAGGSDKARMRMTQSHPIKLEAELC